MGPPRPCRIMPLIHPKKILTLDTWAPYKHADNLHFGSCALLTT